MHSLNSLVKVGKRQEALSVISYQPLKDANAPEKENEKLGEQS
jgi:hypothetical protein